MIRIYSCHFPIKQVSSFRKMKKKINPNLSEDELDSVIKGHTGYVCLLAASADLLKSLAAPPTIFQSLVCKWTF